jgi:hypothetical protein
MNPEQIKQEITECARRAAWVHAFDPGSDQDAIIKDPDLLRLVWSEEDATIMEDYFHDRNNVSQTDSQNAMDRGVISFSEFIDIYMNAKAAELHSIRNNKHE